MKEPLANVLHCRETGVELVLFTTRVTAAKWLQFIASGCRNFKYNYTSELETGLQ